AVSIELGQENIVASIMTRIEGCGRGGEVRRPCFAGDDEVTGMIHDQAVRHIVGTAAQVGGVYQSTAATVKLRYRNVTGHIAGRSASESELEGARGHRV